MGGLSAEERPQIGKVANETRSFIDGLVKDKKAELQQAQLRAALKSEAVDRHPARQAQAHGAQTSA